MSEKQEIFENQIYEKFFIELKKKYNIDKETFYNSKFRLIDYYDLDNFNDATKCTCEVKIKNVNVLRSDILDKEIIIGSECLHNFDKDQEILNYTFVKKCVLCQNLNMGKNRRICNECKQRDKCTKCKSFKPRNLLKCVIFVRLTKNQLMKANRF